MTLSVIRNPDGTLDVSYSEGGVSFQAANQPGSLVDNQPAAEAPAEQPAPVETPAVAPQADASQAATTEGDAQAAPADQAASAAPAASDQPANAAPYKCPQCGAGYDTPGTCSNQHPPAEVLPTEEVLQQKPAGEQAATPDASAEQAATPATPAWPDGGSAGSS